MFGLQAMSVSEFTDTVSCFIRVAWAAAAGKLQLVGSLQPVKDLSATSTSGQHTSSFSGRQPSIGSLGQCLLQYVVSSQQHLCCITCMLSDLVCSLNDVCC